MCYPWLSRFALIQAKTLFLIACISLFAYHPSVAIGQAIVHESRTLAIPQPYAKVLGRLDGKESATEMFASQKVALMEYKPRKADASSNDKQEEGVTRASIDIVGNSHEFGTMHYRMTVAATEKQTTIQVELVQSVGMLRHQKYLYQIVPEGEKKTFITITHTLDVVLMQRRLPLVNRIISKVTYKKACEELHTLTGKMVDSVHCIVHREKRKMETTNAKPSPKEEEDLEEAVEAGAQDGSSSSEQRNDEPKEANNKAENGESPSASPDKQSVMPSRNNSSANLPESNPSTSTLPMANSLAQDREKNVDQDTSAAPKPQKPSPETPPAQPQSATSTPETQEPISSKESVDRKPVVNEATKGVDDASPTPPSSPSPAKGNADSLAQEEPIKPKKKDLRVVIDGLTTSSGTVRIAIFANEKQFKAFDARKEEDSQGEAFKKVGVRVKKSGTLTYEFKEIPYGSYVIAAFHDQDGNKKLNSSFIGMPSEPYGFTRDARNNFGAPRYVDAVIQYDDKSSSFEFKLK